jgi:predicted GIY-YIG superfamily endonuclease
MYVVYQLVNGNGKIEYIGHTKNPHSRLHNHVDKNGRFAGRKDLRLEVIKSGFKKKSRAFDYECKLQKKFGWESDKEKSSRLCKSIQKMGTECRKISVAAYKTTGEFLGIFPTILETARSFDLHTNLVWKVLNNKQKSTKGYIFKKV